MAIEQAKKSRPGGRPVLLLVMVFLLIPLFPARADGFRLGWTEDGILLGAGLGLAALSEVLFQAGTESGLDGIDAAAINPLDSLAVLRYSRALDITSTVLEYSTVALPLLVGLWGSPGQDAAAAVLYLEALSYAYAAKNLLKYFFPRWRPYLYAGVPPGDEPLPTLRFDSFPSGHATIAFTAAACGVMIFSTYFPRSPYLLPFAFSSFGLAALTASFRVLSGMHFITDVTAGALIGMSVGYLIPLIHKDGQGKVTLEASPSSILLRVRY